MNLFWSLLLLPLAQPMNAVSIQLRGQVKLIRSCMRLECRESARELTITLYRTISVRLGLFYFWSHYVFFFLITATLRVHLHDKLWFGSYRSCIGLLRLSYLRVILYFILIIIIYLFLILDRKDHSVLSWSLNNQNAWPFRSPFRVCSRSDKIVHSFVGRRSYPSCLLPLRHVLIADWSVSASSASGWRWQSTCRLLPVFSGRCEEVT